MAPLRLSGSVWKFCCDSSGIPSLHRSNSRPRDAVFVRAHLI
jgi:hypothetical protein